jgi:hypothetical protein
MDEQQNSTSLQNVLTSFCLVKSSSSFTWKDEMYKAREEVK